MVFDLIAEIKIDLLSKGLMSNFAVDLVKPHWHNIFILGSNENTGHTNQMLLESIPALLSLECYGRHIFAGASDKTVKHWQL